MNKLTIKIAVPIVLAGIFAIVVFMAIGLGQSASYSYIIIFLLVIFVFFFGLSTGQSLASPIQKLLDRATELSEGNLSSRVYLETKDELSSLAEIFNKIAEELEDSHQQKMNTEKSVGVKVKARTQELEETINALEQKVKNRTIELERLIQKSNELQENVKIKAEEAAQLRKELDDFTKKLSKTPKPKSEAAEEVINK